MATRNTLRHIPGRYVDGIWWDACVRRTTVAKRLPSAAFLEKYLPQCSSMSDILFGKRAQQSSIFPMNLILRKGYPTIAFRLSFTSRKGANTSLLLCPREPSMSDQKPT